MHRNNKHFTNHSNECAIVLKYGTETKTTGTEQKLGMGFFLNTVKF